jgi:succinylarginine dihydrolase
VRSYLFNSQLLSLADDSMMLVVPGECRETGPVADFLDRLMADTGNPINRVEVFDLKQSMQNGGGPACLRLRVALTQTEYEAMHQGIILTDALFNSLNDWVDAHYRDSLSQADLADPQLLIESRTALDELTRLTGVGAIYPFQR